GQTHGGVGPDNSRLLPCRRHRGYPLRTTARETRSLPAREFPLCAHSWPTPIDPSLLEQFGQPPASIEHSRLHRILRNLENLPHLADRQFVIVYKVDDALVLGRQSLQAATQDRPLVRLLHCHLGVVIGVRERCRRRLVPCFLATLAEAADGAVMGDGQDPCRS